MTAAVLLRETDGWWVIVVNGIEMSAWPDRESAYKIVRLYGFEVAN
jgi:hypothetical protein